MAETKSLTSAAGVRLFWARPIGWQWKGRPGTTGRSFTLAASESLQSLVIANLPSALRLTRLSLVPAAIEPIEPPNW